MHVHVNAAESVDGKLSTRRREQLRISGADDFARVDRIRAAADAVLVGVGTVVADDPHLTVDDPALRADRERDGRPATPARVVAASDGRIPDDARILDGATTTYVLVSEAASPARRRDLEDAGVEMIVAGEDRVDLAAALAELEARGVDSLMAEGGGELIHSLFAAELVDELTVFVGSFVVGGRDAPTLVDGEGFVDAFPDLELTEVERVDDGVLLSYDVGGTEPRA